MSAGQSPRAPAAFRERVRFYLLDHETPFGKALDVGLLALNLVFVGVYVAQTYPLSAGGRSLLWVLEVGIALVFGAEYLFRLYGAEHRFGEATDPYTVVDLLSVLPTFVVLLNPGAVLLVDIGFLRVLRVIRVLRFYRFTKDEEFFFGTVEASTLRVLKLVLTVFTVFFVSAGLFYSVEVGANPNITNFGDGFYFTVITLSTVGFGDIVPATQLGRWVTVAAVLSAVILIPRQVGGIVRAWTERDKVEVTCPECGLQYHDPDAVHCKACGATIYQEYDSRES